MASVRRDEERAETDEKPCQEAQDQENCQKKGVITSLLEQLKVVCAES